MSEKDLDLSDSLSWADGLPRPQWDLIEAWVESHDEPERRDAWVAAGRQWMAALGAALGKGYEATESDHFLVLAPQADGLGQALSQFAERCRAALLSLLGGVADFEGRG